jgi:hypothetical protein
MADIAAKEAFVSNLNGTSPQEVVWITLVVPVCIIFRCILLMPATVRVKKKKKHTHTACFVLNIIQASYFVLNIIQASYAAVCGAHASLALTHAVLLQALEFLLVPLPILLCFTVTELTPLVLVTLCLLSALLGMMGQRYARGEQVSSSHG